MMPSRLVVLVLSALAVEAALVAHPQNPTTTKPATAQATVVPPAAPLSVAGVRIASVSPKSVRAGASFTVAIQLPENFQQPITLTVHRFGLNIEQYRRENLRDDDSLDGAQDEPGVIIHRIATNATWTSAQALVSQGAKSDKYLVMIESPLTLQTDQTLTVLGTGITASIDTIKSLAENVVRGRQVLDALKTKTGSEPTPFSVYSLGSDNPLHVDDQGSAYVMQASRDTEPKLAYLRGQDFLWATPDDLPVDMRLRAPGSGTPRKTMFLFSNAVQEKELRDEIAAIEVLLKQLDPGPAINIASLQRQLNILSPTGSTQWY